MESDLYLIDHNANTKDSLFHRASITSKILLFTVFLGFIIQSKSPTQLLFFLFIESLLILSSEINPINIIKWSLYPLAFALIFAASNLDLAPLIILRAYDMMILSLFFINTTPYPKLFELISKLSVTLSNVAFLTYRFFFLLVENLGNSITIMKVRGGGPTRLENLSYLIGNLILTATDKTERVYNAMLARGYTGRIYTLHTAHPLTLADIPVFLTTALVFMGGMMKW